MYQKLTALCRRLFHHPTTLFSESVGTVVLGLIHTCDFLGVNYCVNFSVHAIAKNGYITHY